MICKACTRQEHWDCDTIKKGGDQGWTWCDCAHQESTLEVQSVQQGQKGGVPDERVQRNDG